MVDDYTRYYRRLRLFSRKDYLVETLIVIRRDSVKLNKQFYIWIQIFSCLQVLSIIFDPERSNAMPWNYSSLDILWTTLGLLTRPYLILEYLNVSILALILLPLGYLLMVGLYYLIFLHIKRRISPLDNLTTIEPRYIELIKIESLLRYLLLDAGYLSVLLLHRYLFHSDLEYSVCLLVLITLLYLPLIYTEGYYLMTLNWNSQAYNTMSHPEPYFCYKLIYLGLVYSNSFLTFSRNPIEYSIVFMVFGAYLVKFFAYKQPYVRFTVNYIQSLKGVALFLAGLIMLIFTILDIVDDSSYAATITFFALMPFLSFLVKELMIRRRNYVLNNLHNYSNTFECFIKIKKQRYQHYSMIHDEEDSMNGIMRIRKAHRYNFYVYIWLLYLLLDAENFSGVCLLLSRMRRLTHTIQQRSFIHEFKQEFYNSVQQNKDLKEAVDFLSYHRKIESLEQKEEYCCYSARKVYQELATSRDINILSKYIIQYIEAYQDTKYFYTSIFMAFRSTSEFQESYVDFLKKFENKELVGNDIIMRELNREAENLERSPLSLIHANDLVMIVSLHKSDAGYVFIVHNAEKFGYTRDQLLGRKYFMLFPDKLSKYLNAIQTKTRNYFNLHDLFISAHSLYILSNSKYLQAVNVKFRVTNAKFNELCGVVTFVSDNKGVEIALLSDDGRRIVHIVRST